jgi:hypothetical protein
MSVLRACAVCAKSSTARPASLNCEAHQPEAWSSSKRRQRMGISGGMRDGTATRSGSRNALLRRWRC